MNLFIKSKPGSKQTIVSYNASVVKIYNTMGSLVRFKNKNIFFYFGKSSCLPQLWRCRRKIKSRRIDTIENFTFSVFEFDSFFWSGCPSSRKDRVPLTIVSFTMHPKCELVCCDGFLNTDPGLCQTRGKNLFCK
jgi:hypothetical protein